MQVISEEVSLPQALALETSLIQDALAQGRKIYNTVLQTVSPSIPIEVPKTLTPNIAHLNPAIYR